MLYLHRPRAAWATSAVTRGTTVFTHSAESAEFRGGRLILRGVDRHGTLASSGGKSGVVSIARLHRRLFSPGMPPVTGVLHIAGQRSARDVSLKLTGRAITRHAAR